MPSGIFREATSTRPSRLVCGRRAFRQGHVLPYIVAQVVGASSAAAVLWVIATGKPGLSWPAVSPPTATANIRPENTASRPASVSRSGPDLHVPVRHHRLDPRQGSRRLCADPHRSCLTLIHLISIPVTNTSVNPARSTGPALFAGGGAIGQLWLFWVAPDRRRDRRRALSLAQHRTGGTGDRPAVA